METYLLDVTRCEEKWWSCFGTLCCIILNCIVFINQVNQDTTPEEFASYSFKISASGAQADNSSGALEARIDVAASDSPYGLLVFDPPLVHNVSEDKGYVNLTVRRKDGNIGHLKVNLTVSGSTAVEGKDYTISSTRKLYLITYIHTYFIKSCHRR